MGLQTGQRMPAAETGGLHAVPVDCLQYTQVVVTKR